MRIKKLRKKAIHILLTLLFLAVCVCGHTIYIENKIDTAADAAADRTAALKPEPQNGNGDPDMPDMDFTDITAANPDIIAWLSIPGTVIDYPVVQAADNAYYLEHDALKKYNKNGALFLDYRLRSDFSDFNNVIYGHHMKSGRMFQSLIKFKDKAFFDSHKTGLLYTRESTLRLEIFAMLLTTPNSELYGYAFTSVREKEHQLQIIRESALHYRDIDAAADDRILLLSTCSYEYKEARTVVAARLKTG